MLFYFSQTQTSQFQHICAKIPRQVSIQVQLNWGEKSFKLNRAVYCVYLKGLTAQKLDEPNQWMKSEPKLYIYKKNISIVSD